MQNIFYYDTVIGPIGIAAVDTQITHVLFQSDACPAGYLVQETALITQAAQQIREYLLGQRQEFSLPLAPQGTAFMRSVWNCLCDIPYAETRSYLEIAKAVGNAKACRAVGQANNRNPIPIIIPCHRVIGANGKLTGYRSGLAIKELLIDLENQHSNKGR